MKRLIVLSLASLVISAGGTVSPAEADPGNRFDLYALTGRALHVNSGSCRNIAISARINAASDYHDIYAEVDVWRGNSYQGTASLEGEGASHRLTGSYYYCPYEGLGTFRLGQSEVSWSQYDDDWNYYYDGEFTDTTRGTTIVKQASRVALTGKRQGKVRKFQSVGQYFDTGVSRWLRDPKNVRMTLQRRPASNTAAWRRVKVVRTNKKGVANFRIQAKGTYRYRVVSAGTTRSWLGISRVISR
jgi:hypothetical protein